MTCRKGIVVGLALCWALSFGMSASAQQGDDVVLTTHHINPVRDARTPWDEVKNCLSDTVCSTAVNAIAAQIGIPANAVKLVNAGAAFSAKQDGEETRYSISALSNRQVCRVEIRTTSVVPATGDRASLFSLNATAGAISIYTWTPRQGVGAGRSWYDGMLFVGHVKNELASDFVKAGKCTISKGGKPASYECRGSSGVNHGLMACGSKDL